MAKRKQTTSNIFMVRPAHFGFNKETFANNSFQKNDDSISTKKISKKALEEFDQFVEKLRKNGINVLVGEDDPNTVKPDAVFPNNWITFHEDGLVITYPMFAESRRTERQLAHIEKIVQHFDISKKIELDPYEKINIFLEGTGSLVLDRTNKIAYACISPRTHDTLIKKFCDITGYEQQVFQAVDENNQAIYHTNVMMTVGEDFVIICKDSIQNKEEKKRLVQRFKDTNKEIINISFDQLNSFAGNMLQVENEKGETFLVMSERAFKALKKKQIKQIEKYTTILHSPLKTIENYGGGSARCMIAEIFLPPISDEVEINFDLTEEE